MRVAPLVVESVLVVALVAGGAWLRWTHLGTPSLWYDELVHVRTADRESVGEVWRAARDGVMPGTGNAGAVPLDYLALHAWLRATAAPAPEGLERHHRVPSFVFSVLALPLAWALGRSAGGPVVGAIALALLATSVPHVVYAAEARFFSLSVLATLVNVAAFAALVRTPSAARGVLFGLASVGYVLSALYGVFPVAAEHVVLAVMAVRARRWTLLAVVGATALVAAAVVAWWTGPTAISTVYPRAAPALLGTLPALRETLAFFAADGRGLAWVFAAAILALPLAAPREARPLAAVIVLSLCAIPVMVAIAHWKHYYYHPRHGLFLLPLVHLATALVLARALAAARIAPRAAAAAGVALVLVAAGPAVAAFVADPMPFFHRTKTHRDFRGLARAIASRTASQTPDERLLLLLERRRPGHLANPMLAYYLEAYGIVDGVTVAGIGEPLPILQRLPGLCPGGCRGPASTPVLAALGLREPFDQLLPTRRFLRLPMWPFAREWSAVAVIAWAPNVPATTPPGFAVTPFDGGALYDLAIAGAPRP